MKCIGKVVRSSDGHVFVADNDGNELSVFEHVGQSLFTGDCGALIKELRELRKDKARKQYLVDLLGQVTTLDNWSDAAIDAAIAKSENAVMNGSLSAQAPCDSMYSEWTDEAKGRLKSALGDVFVWKSR